MAKFAELFSRLAIARTRGNIAEIEAIERRIGEELDLLEVGSLEVGRNITNTVNTVLGNSQGNAQDNSVGTAASIKTDETFLVQPSSDSILQFHLISCKLNTSGSGVIAYLADATNSQRRANAVVVSIEYISGARMLRCASSGTRKVRMDSTSAPSYDSNLFVSTTPGTAGSDPTSGGARAFSQEVGLFLGPGLNALGQPLSGVALVQVSLPPPSSMTVGSAV